MQTSRKFKTFGKFNLAKHPRARAAFGDFGQLKRGIVQGIRPQDTVLNLDNRQFAFIFGV